MDPTAATDFLQSAAAGSAGGRLIYLGLGRRLPALLSYLVFIAILTFLYGVIDRFSKLYFWIYVFLAPLENIFSILVVRELLTLMFKDYPGIRTVGRWAMYAGIVVSAGTSLALTKFFWNTGAQGRRKWGIFYFEITQRSIVFSLVVVIFAILFVLSKYPLNLSRNTYVSCIFFSALFLSEAARLLLDSMARVACTTISVDQGEAILDRALSLQLGISAAAGSGLRFPRTAVPTPQEDHLLQQLEALNKMMARSGQTVDIPSIFFGKLANPR